MGGLDQGEHNINLDIMTIFVKNNYLLAKLQSVLRKHTDLFTHLKHKEIILGARKKY